MTAFVFVALAFLSRFTISDFIWMLSKVSETEVHEA